MVQHHRHAALLLLLLLHYSNDTKLRYFVLPPIDDTATRNAGNRYRPIVHISFLDLPFLSFISAFSSSFFPLLPSSTRRTALRSSNDRSKSWRELYIYIYIYISERLPREEGKTKETRRGYVRHATRLPFWSTHTHAWCTWVPAREWPLGSPLKIGRHEWSRAPDSIRNAA